MMQILRENTKIIIWVIVIAFVGTIIFAWGMDFTGMEGGCGGAPQNAVGIVNGIEIPRVSFDRATDQMVENERTKNPEKEIGESDYRQARQLVQLHGNAISQNTIRNLFATKQLMSM